MLGGGFSLNLWLIFSRVNFLPDVKQWKFVTASQGHEIRGKYRGQLRHQFHWEILLIPMLFVALFANIMVIGENEKY